MRRLQLFEITETPWCLPVWRDGVNDYRQWSNEACHVYDAGILFLAELLRGDAPCNVIDLASGGGGPWMGLRAALLNHRVDARVLLTDLAPDLRAFARAELLSSGAIRGDLRSIDARNPPADLQGTRTMFSAIHRFSPDDATSILQDAVRAGFPIAVFERVRGSWIALLASLFVPFAVLIATPRLRPFSWLRLFWTYVLPVIPVIAWFDTTARRMQAYSVDELLRITRRIETPADWSWKVLELSDRSPTRLAVLIGQHVAHAMSGSGATSRTRENNHVVSSTSC